MAELILDGKAHSVDISPLSIERFASGHLFDEKLTTHSH